MVKSALMYADRVQVLSVIGNACSAAYDRLVAPMLVLVEIGALTSEQFDQFMIEALRAGSRDEIAENRNVKQAIRTC